MRAENCKDNEKKKHFVKCNDNALMSLSIKKKIYVYWHKSFETPTLVSEHGGIEYCETDVDCQSVFNLSRKEMFLGGLCRKLPDH